MPATLQDGDEERVMPWGIYAGQTLGEIPSDYLKWVAEDARDDGLCCAAERVWAWREKYDLHI